MNPGPLTALFHIIDRDVVPERWRQHKTWASQRKSDLRWDLGLTHHLAEVKAAMTSAYRRQQLVHLATLALAAIEDMDNRSHDRAVLQPPVHHLDPEGVLQ